MLRVCHMTSAHRPEDVRIFHKECVSLAKAGYEVYLVERGESYEKNGVHIVGVGEIPDSRIKRMTEGTRMVYEKALSLDCDVYHFHDPELLPYGLKLKRQGKKVVFDCHENTADAILEKQYLPRGMRSLVHTLYVRYQNYVCRRLDAIVTVTPSLTRAFQKVHPSVWEVRNYPILEERGTEQNCREKTIVFAGGISEQWNHHILLKAMERVPEYRYCLCGSAGEAYLQKLREMPAWDRVDYLGKIPHEEVAELMSKAYLGVALLSPGRNTDGHNGTMGNTKIFEEMMAGLPVICTDFVLWKEFVERYDCGVCLNPSNIDEIVNALQYLLDNPDRAEEMGQNGAIAVKQEFQWKEAALVLLKLYSLLT